MASVRHMGSRNGPLVRRFFGLAASLGLTIVGCGGVGSDPTAETADTFEPGRPSSSTTVPRTDPMISPPVSSSTTAVSTTAVSTTAVSTTEVTAPVPVAAGEIPDLVGMWADAVEDPTSDPLELAQRLTGFPVPVGVPEGSTVWRVDLDMRSSEAGWNWDWRYSAHVPEPVGDVDITLEDNGPGAVRLRQIYDPILSELGWTYSNSTGSDPGERGGPNSINHVYRFDSRAMEVGSFVATPTPLFVWLDEDLVFGDEVQRPGYQIDVGVTMGSGLIPVPLLAAVLDGLPALPGAELTRLDFSSFERPETSFAAEFGLYYLGLDAVLEFSLADEAVARELFLSLDGPVIRAGSESFFDPGFYEATEPLMYDGTDWTLDLLVLDRYPASVRFETDDVTGIVAARIDVAFEPLRPALRPLPG